MSQGDLGKDYEHCMELQRKLNDAGSGATRGVDKERIDQIFQARQMKNEITKFVLNSLSIQMAAKLPQLKPKERKSTGYPGGAHGSTVL